MNMKHILRYIVFLMAACVSLAGCHERYVTYSECQSMERLVGDLLLLSKMKNPDFLVEKEPVTLQQVF